MTRDDARQVREAPIMCDPFRLCEALNLVPDAGRGRTWFDYGANGIAVPCPWHHEATGSCSVRRASDGTVAVHCFGCGVSGDALSLVAVTHGLEPRAQFRAVLETAASIAGVNLSTPYVSHAPALRPKPAPPPEPVPVDDGGAMDAIADVLRRVAPLDGQPDVAAYVEARGLARAASGWYALPATAMELDTVRDMIVRAVGDAAWLRSGLCAADGPNAGRWTFAQHRLVIPWCAPNGAVTTLQRRPIIALDGVGKYVFARDHRPVCPWGWYEATETMDGETVLAITEGAVDAASFDALHTGHNWRAVGIPGVDGWRASWAQLFRGRGVFVAFDADKAGDAKAPTVAAMLYEAGAQVVERYSPSGGKDWNDTLRAVRARSAA